MVAGSASVSASMVAASTNLGSARGSRTSCLVVGNCTFSSFLDYLEAIVCHIFVIFILLLIAGWIPIASMVGALVIRASSLEGVSLLTLSSAFTFLRLVTLTLSVLILRVPVVSVEHRVVV